MSRWQQLSKLLGLAAEDVAKLSPETLSTLERVSTPEISTALKGSERAKYLQALDEAYGNQDARAKAMGFGDKTYYHGTNSDIDAFDINKVGSHTGEGSTKDRFWFTDQPETADHFAKSAATMDTFKKYQPIEKEILDKQYNLETQLEKTLSPDFKLNELLKASDRDLSTFKKFGDLNSNQIQKLEEIKSLEKSFQDLNSKRKLEASDSSGNIIPVRLRTNGIKEKDMLNTHWGDTGHSMPEGEVRLKNFGEDYADAELPYGESVGILTPSKVRSVNAAFDPRFKDSSKLLAGAGAIPAVNMDLGNQVKQFSQDVAQPIVERYQKLKDMVTTPLAKQLDLTKDKSVTEDMKTGLDLGLDPINLLGPASGGAAALFEMLGSKKKEDNGK